MAPKEEEQQQQQQAAAARATDPADSQAAAAAAAATAAAAPRADSAVAPPAAAPESSPPTAAEQRALAILDIVLERQRQAAREARQASRRELLRAAESSPAPRGLIEFASGGAANEDGEDGAVTGGGWRREPLVDANHLQYGGGVFAPPPGEGEGEDAQEEDDDDDNDNEDEGEGEGEGEDDEDVEAYGMDWGDVGGSGSGCTDLAVVPPPAQALSEDVDYFATAGAAAGASKAWRALALRAVDRLSIVLPQGRPRLGAHGQADAAGLPRDPLALLRALEGGRGVLRALRVTGAPPKNNAQAAAAARLLGLARPSFEGTTSKRADAALAGVLRGLRVLHVEDMLGCLDAAATRKRKAKKAQAQAQAQPPPQVQAQAPPLASLVFLQLDRFPSIYVKYRQVISKKRALRPAVELSLRNLPSLRDLRVTLSPNSDGPLSLGGRYSGGGTPHLTCLDVGGLVRGAPPRGEGYAWPVGEVLLVSSASLSCLANTLIDCRVEGTWASSTFDDGCCTPSEPSDWDEDMSWEAESEDEDKPRGAVASVDLLEAGECSDWSLEPMRRLHDSYRGLSRLTALTLDSDYDFEPAPVLLGHVNFESRMAARRREWSAAARTLLAPMAPTLRSLTIAVPGFGGNRREVHLPPALSTLTALTSLRVACYCLHSVGPLGRLVTLRRLELEGDVPLGRHAAYFGRDLTGLTALEHLRLLEPPACVAPVIADALPSLETLVLRDGGAWHVGKKASVLPPSAVLDAAAVRVARGGGVRVFFARDKEDLAPRGPASVAGLRALMALVDGKRDADKERRTHDAAHARGIAKADRMAAADAQ